MTLESPLCQLRPEAGITLPFSVVHQPGEVVIRLRTNSMFDPSLTDARSYTWITGVSGRVVIDVSLVQMMNSSACSWIINLMLSAKPAEVSIRGARASAAKTLRIVGMGALMAIDEAGEVDHPGRLETVGGGGHRLSAVG